MRVAMPSSARVSAAASDSCSVMPAPTTVTSSESDERNTRDPPIANCSSGG